jgi:hypothetical protein
MLYHLGVFTVIGSVCITPTSHTKVSSSHVSNNISVVFSEVDYSCQYFWSSMFHVGSNGHQACYTSLYVRLSTTMHIFVTDNATR